MYKSEDTASQIQMSEINAQDEVRTTQKQKSRGDRTSAWVQRPMYASGIKCIIGQSSAWLSKAVPRRLRVH